MYETEVDILNNNVKLSGTLCLPSETGSYPVVLMIHGSGDIDRNENSKTQKLNIFNVISQRLAKHGIASFRYDKRGVGKSEGDFYSTGHFQLIEDAGKCLDFLFESKHCNKESIFLLGHSEGTLIASRLSQSFKKTAGIILLAPFIENIETIMMKQSNTIKLSARQLSGFKKYYINLIFSIFDPVKSQRRLIKKITGSTNEVEYSMFQKIPAKWIRELISLDPREIYENVTCSSLVIGGTKDIQCNPDDIEIIEGLLKGRVESHVIENMSHILRLESGKPSVFNYPELIKKPIDENLLEIIINWINREKDRHNN